MENSDCTATCVFLSACVNTYSIRGYACMIMSGMVPTVCGTSVKRHIRTAACRLDSYLLTFFHQSYRYAQAPDRKC